MNIPKKIAIIVAGGSGSRLNASLPKQFLPIGGIPMLAYSIIAFHQEDPETEIIVVLPEGFDDQWKKLAHEAHIDIPHKIVPGGHERFYSVSNALHTLRPHQAVVAIHDAARPFASVPLIRQAFHQATKTGSAIPAIGVKDSIRVKSLDSWAVIDRSLVRAIQTPQVFELEPLKKAYEHPHHLAFTDDATVYESAGYTINLIEGEDRNIKVTTPADLEYAEYLMSRS